MSPERDDGRRAAYAAPASLYALWQAGAGWLVTAWSIARLGAASATGVFAMFFVANAAGMAVSALWLDRKPPARRQRLATAASAAIAGAATASLATAHGGWLVAACLLAGAAAGFPIALLTQYAVRSLPPEGRGATLGLASAAGLAAHFLLFVVAFPRTDGPSLIAKTAIASVAAVLIGAVALVAPARRCLWESPAGARDAGPAGERGAGPAGARGAGAAVGQAARAARPRARGRLAALLFGAVACFFVSYGMQDYAATGYWMSANSSLGYTRLFMIAGLPIAGLAWDRRSRGSLFISSFGLLAMGFACMAFEYRGAASFIGFSSVQVAAALFPLAVRLILIERAERSRRPALVSSLGLALPLVLKQAGIVSAALLYAAAGGVSIFVSSLALIAAGTALAARLFERARAEDAALAAAAGPEPRASTGAGDPAALAAELSARFGFTPRELQVAELSLRGRTIVEMAGALSLSEPTIKLYVRRVLEKTGTKNQKQLLSAVLRDR